MDNPITITYERTFNYQMRVWINKDMGVTSDALLEGLKSGKYQMRGSGLSETSGDEIVDPSLPEGRRVVAYFESERLCESDENAPKNFAVE